MEEERIREKERIRGETCGGFSDDAKNCRVELFMKFQYSTAAAQLNRPADSYSNDYR